MEVNFPPVANDTCGKFATGANDAGSAPTLSCEKAFRKKIKMASRELAAAIADKKFHS